MTVLKECPFCGGNAEFKSKYHSGGGYDDGNYSYGVKCTVCGVETGYYCGYDIGNMVAARIWNTRPGNPEPIFTSDRSIKKSILQNIGWQ